LTEIQPDNLVCFLSANYNSLLEELSEILQNRVNWITVYEPMKARGFLCFENGSLVDQLFDPEQQFRSNIWSGEDMAGRGPRTFKSAEEFLSAIAGRYIPVDRLWSFAAWENLRMRETMLMSAESRIHWSLRMDPAGTVIEHIGNVPLSVASQLPARSC
jgi:hypothetical protein